MNSSLELNIPTVVAEVRQAFERYDLALDENDVGVLDDSFWRHELTQRYGPAANQYGHAEIASYRRARDPAQLQTRARRLEKTIITTFGHEFAVANTEYVLLSNGKHGRQSQTWVKFPEGWKVVSAHVSLLAEG